VFKRFEKRLNDGNSLCAADTNDTNATFTDRRRESRDRIGRGPHRIRL